MLPHVLMYCSHVCPYCHMALSLLKRRGVEPERVYVDELPSRRQEMIRLTGRTSVPQIFIGEYHVGGYQELAGLERGGQLATLLHQDRAGNTTSSAVDGQRG